MVLAQITRVQVPSVSRIIPCRRPLPGAITSPLTANRALRNKHAGIYPYEKGGQTRYAFTFHYYDGLNDGKSGLGIRELVWKDSWPVVTNKVPERFSPPDGS